jgi:NitT/TauT family transport system ATP-binding protein
MKYGVKNISKSYGELEVLRSISIDFQSGEVTCILGPSGCGKTTLLNIITGAEEHDSGEITGFENETISFIFQEERLIEWKTVWENLKFVLKDKMPGNEINATITKYLKAVDLLEYKDFYPNKLSGGMRQRVSIVRAFIFPSRVMIMDEPFKSLDKETKQGIMECFLSLMKQEKRTTIMVTHDVEEAIYLSDNIITLSAKPAQIISKIS